MTLFLRSSSLIKSYSSLVLRSIKKKLTLDRSNIFWRSVKTVFRLEGISFFSSASVRIFKNPIRKLELSFPLSRPPAIILFSIVLPSLSLATPIRLEKNGITSLVDPKSLNKSSFWVKNCLFSGSDISKRLMFTIWSSTSTWEKSGLKVRSRFRAFPIGILASPPIEAFVFLLEFVKSS